MWGAGQDGRGAVVPVKKEGMDRRREALGALRRRRAPLGTARVCRRLSLLSPHFAGAPPSPPWRRRQQTDVWGKGGGRGGTGPGSAQRERGLRPERPVTRSGRWRGGRGRDTGTRAGVARAPAAGWGLPSGIVGDREEGKGVERSVPRASGAALPVRLPPSLAFSYYFLGFKKNFLFSIFFSLYLLYFHFSFFCFVLSFFLSFFLPPFC